MKLLAVPAFLSAIAVANAEVTAFRFINPTIPTDVEVGTEIKLEWTSQDYTGPFTLSVLAFNRTPDHYETTPIGSFPIYDDIKIHLADLPSAAGGTFTWKAAPVDDAGVWTGREFLYQIDADLSSTSGSSAGAFYLTA